MLTPDEQAAWQAYEAEMQARGVEVDLNELIDVLHRLDDSAPGRLIAEALGVGAVPIRELAQRLTLQTRRIVQTGRVPN